MRETLADWRKEWIKANGETHELEVLICEDEPNGVDPLVPYVYQGSFADIPQKLLDRKVVGSGKIESSSLPERIGAYSLTIDSGPGQELEDDKRTTREHYTSLLKYMIDTMPTLDALMELYNITQDIWRNDTCDNVVFEFVNDELTMKLIN